MSGSAPPTNVRPASTDHAEQGVASPTSDRVRTAPGSVWWGWLEEEGDTHVVSLVRGIVGVLLLLSALREISLLGEGPHFADIFHLSILPEGLVPGSTVYAALTWGQLVLALFALSGRLARPALLVSALTGVYLLLCNRLAYHNNRYALFLFAFLLAFAPCDRAFVWPRRAAPLPPRGPLWATRLVQLQIALIYAGSGTSKALDPDWRGGLVLGDRLLRETAKAVERGVPAVVMDVLTNPAIASGVAKLAILTELFLLVGLFFRRTRGFAFWWGTMFHVTIEMTSQVELFGALTLTMYALFATPTRRERVILYDPRHRVATAAVAVLRRLDWLARFEMRASPDSATKWGLVLVDREGVRSDGWRALAKVARATPLLLPLAGPLFCAAAILEPRVSLPLSPRPNAEGR